MSDHLMPAREERRGYRIYLKGKDKVYSFNVTKPDGVLAYITEGLHQLTQWHCGLQTSSLCIQ